MEQRSKIFRFNAPKTGDNNKHVVSTWYVEGAEVSNLMVTHVWFKMEHNIAEREAAMPVGPQPGNSVAWANIVTINQDPTTKRIQISVDHWLHDKDSEFSCQFIRRG